MAVYRWRQSTVSNQETRSLLANRTQLGLSMTSAYQMEAAPVWNGNYYDFSGALQTNRASSYTGNLAFSRTPTSYYSGSMNEGWDNGTAYWIASSNCYLVSRSITAGDFVGYVYSTNSSAYPNGGVSGEYYYDQMQEMDFTPIIEVPLIAMQGNQIAISWSAVDGADGYILERNADNGGWTQVYSGANTSFEETVGTWTSVQYRVKAGVDGTYGDYTTSASVPVVSASAVVISGTDGDLGTLVNDVTYTVSSDGSTELTVVETINGTETRTFTATNGATNKIPVVDLPTGYGTIKITASTNPGSGVVTVTREWTYTKAAITFPDAGSVADLTQQGKTIWAKTLAEAVRTPSIWGGNLGLALAKLAGAVLYNRTQQPKYAVVNVNLANATVGQEINLPYNGVMTPHIVVHIGNPNPSLYDASCDGVWLWRKGIAGSGVWNSSNVNTLSGSDIMTTMAGHVSNYASDVQADMKTVKIPYCVGNGSSTVNSGANGLECKAFPLGAYEVGITTSDFSFIPVDGTKLDYFMTGRIAEANELRAGARSWLRSPTVGETLTATAWLITADGNVGTNTVNVSDGLSPAFIMPTTFTATYYVGSDGTVHDEQEYEEAGTFTDIFGDAVPVPRIETGSYVGTGALGNANPSSLTFSAPPAFLLISNGGASHFILMDVVALTTSFTARAYLYVETDGALKTTSTVYAKRDGNTVSWYIDEAKPYAQCNQQGLAYTYLALLGGAA